MMQIEGHLNIIEQEVKSLRERLKKQRVREDVIKEFRDYQIEWLTAHFDIEFCKEEEDLIIRFLNDTADCFVKEMNYGNK